MAKKKISVIETQMPNGILKREYPAGGCTEYLCMDVLENQMRRERKWQAEQKKKGLNIWLANQAKG